MSKEKVEIIYQDDDIIVINKPAGVSVTKDRSGTGQLRDLLVNQLPEQTIRQLRLIHRLDKDTSGVMILAKNIDAQRKFSGYFEQKQVRKLYLALAAGFVRGQEGTINSALAPNPKDPQLMCIAVKKGKEAITNWKLLADFGPVSLLAVMPLTGRTHQIRVHLASIGLPVAIDPLYGSSQPLLLSDFKAGYHLRKGQTEKPLIERLTLHAYQIELPQSAFLIDNRKSTIDNYFIAPLDKKFAATIKMLTKHNPKGPDAFIDPDDFSKILNGDGL